MFIRVKTIIFWCTTGVLLGRLHLVIFFNNIFLELNQSKIIKYVDDTFIFFADKDYDKVERALCSDMNRLSEWFTENELLLNLKPGKTELLVFVQISDWLRYLKIWKSYVTIRWLMLLPRISILE